MSRRSRRSKRRPSDTRPRPEIAVDLEDHGDEYVLIADLPGVRKQDIDLFAKKNRVRIRVDSDEGEGAAGPFVRGVRERGPVSRTVRLPQWVNERRTNAEYLNGRLRVTLPKRRPRRSVDIE